MAVLAPVDVEGPAIEHDTRSAAGQAAARCRDERRAGAGAAGAGDAGAAFPDAQADPGAIEDRCDADIGALGKQLVVLEPRAERGQVDCLGIRHKKCRVRVADICADRLGKRTERESGARRIHLARQRDLMPGGAGRPHIDRDIAIRRQLGVEQARRGLDADARLAALLCDEAGDAARPVAAGLRLAAIGVEDAHKDLRRGVARRLDQDQLVTADAGAPVGKRARRRRVDHDAVAAAVEHDKIVAEPMHLAERDVRHAAAYMAARPGMSNAARSRLALCGVPLAAAGALTLCRDRSGLRGVRLGMRQPGHARLLVSRRDPRRLGAAPADSDDLPPVGRPGLRGSPAVAIARSGGRGYTALRFRRGLRPELRFFGLRRDAHRGRRRDGERRLLAHDRTALVAEIIRRDGRRVEVPGSGGRLREAGPRDPDRRHHGQGGDDVEARFHLLRSFHSARLIRSIENRSLVRAYQPRPCMRPIRRILSV